MCGIYGIVRRGGSVTSSELESHAARLAHRGPDDHGVWIAPSGGAGLAHRRLAIVDLSPRGHQPMRSADSRKVIVFNGEIYNFQALREELEGDGRRFEGHSDTEVLLGAYEAWGTDCVEKLNGMFAFAIYDEGNDSRRAALFFARDRAGEKPFYYASDDSRFEFASELKAMTVSGGIDADALNHYLALGYVPGDRCIAAGVRKLPPGHAGLLDVRTMAMNTWQYWSLPPNTGDPRADGESLTDEAGRLLETSVRDRMVCDVPLGVLLSGGLDSSLVVAAAARQSAARIKTFTITLPGSPLDESTHAERVARHFGTDHHVLPLEHTGLDALLQFGEFVDEPIGDSSLLPAFLVSRLTRRQVTVALGGDGGDELFGGYGDYTQSLADQALLGRVPAPLLRIGAAMASLLPAGMRGRNRIASLRNGPLQQMVWGSPYFDAVLRRRCLTAAATRRLGDRHFAPEQFLLGRFQTGADPIDAMTRTHFGSILPDDFLVKVDRASMAVGLEMRAPFLDRNLIEFAFGRVPSRWKVSGGESRRLQRLLAQRWLPADFDVARKQGFSIPLDDWLLSADPNRIRECCANLPSCIRPGIVDTLIIGLQKGRANGARLFALMMLGIAARNLKLQWLDEST